MSESSLNLPVENTYFIDPESSAELARLLHQDRLTTKYMGGLFAEQADLSMIHTILDVACGPGGWALEVAEKYRHINVVGIDISQSMIEYARALAKAQKLQNIEFCVMNALKPLDFSNDHFDLINARFLFAFMPPDGWPALLRECMRVCRAGGIIRVTEGEAPISNSPAFEKMTGLTTLALTRAGQSFSPDGRHTAITTMLERLLRDAGCEAVQLKAHVLNFSAGAEAHSGWYHNSMVASQLLQPFLIKMGVATQGELNQLYPQMLKEMREENFCGIHYFLTAWGNKPRSVAARA